MGKYIDQVALENALTAQTVATIFTESGVFNQMALNDVIDRAEGEVDSFLITVNDLSKIQRYDRELRVCALDFAKVFTFERSPEYERTFGEYPRGRELYKRAKDRMERVQSAVQMLPDQTGPKPSNVGSIIRDDGVRMMTTDPQGNRNGDGF